LVPRCNVTAVPASLKTAISAGTCRPRRLPASRAFHLTGSLDRARRVPQPTYCGAAPVIVYFAAGIQAVLVLS
jgi:hypothetical protein